MDSLGACKPSELLLRCWSCIPRGKEAKEFFLFLQRLPRELRIMLGDDPDHNARALAAKANKLWANHSHHQPGSVAATVPASSDDEDQPAVAAIHNIGAIAKGSAGKQKSAGSETNPLPAVLARNLSRLCIFHWQFGKKAYNCASPCSWQGN